MRTRTTTPGARRSPFLWRRSPRWRTGGPSAAPSSRRSGKLEPRRARRRSRQSQRRPAPAPPADDGWGDDAWGDDVPAKPVALKSSPKKTGRKTLPKKTGTLSLSKGMFSKDQKAAPPPKAKTEEQIKAEKLKAAAAAMKAAPVSKLPADDRVGHGLLGLYFSILSGRRSR